LLWAAAIYLARLVLDTAGGLRILFLHGRTRRHPSRALEHPQATDAIRNHRAVVDLLVRTVPHEADRGQSRFPGR
jgi:hypothetical protein